MEDRVWILIISYLKHHLHQTVCYSIHKDCFQVIFHRLCTATETVAPSVAPNANSECTYLSLPLSYIELILIRNFEFIFGQKYQKAPESIVSQIHTICTTFKVISTIILELAILYFVAIVYYHTLMFILLDFWGWS